MDSLSPQSIAQFDALRQAAAQGDAATIKSLAAAGADLNALREGYSPLLFCALKTPGWSPEAMRALLDLGADPSIWDSRGKSLISSALCYSHNAPGAMEITRMLCEHPRVDLSALDEHQNSLLGLCFYAPELIGLMVARGADPNGSCSGRRVLERITGQGPSGSRFDADTTPMGYASGFGVTDSARLVSELAAAGADPNARPEGGVPALPYLIGKGYFHFEHIEKILEIGADPDWRYPDGASLMDRARETAKSAASVARLEFLLSQARARVERSALELIAQAPGKRASRNPL